MSKFVSISIPILLALLNVYIYFDTTKTIEVYKDNPPFFAIDFTNSHKQNPLSSVNNLLDKNPKTFWVKESKTIGDIDFEIELRLSHIYNQGYQRRDFKRLVVKSCNKKKYSRPKVLILKLFLREAINVDKVLRLPEDRDIAKYRVEFASNLVKIDISDVLVIQESKGFPENIYIIGVRGKVFSYRDTSTKPCLADIYLE